MVWLEYILGTPHVFHLPERTRALLIHKLNLYTLSHSEQERALLLRAMMEFCIYPPSQHTYKLTKSKKYTQSSPSTSSRHRSPHLDKSSAERTSSLRNDEMRGNPDEDIDSIPSASMVAWSCSEEALLKLIKSRDPSGDVHISMFAGYLWTMDMFAPVLIHSELPFGLMTQF